MDARPSVGPFAGGEGTGTGAAGGVGVLAGGDGSDGAETLAVLDCGSVTVLSLPPPDCDLQPDKQVRMIAAEIAIDLDGRKPVLLTTLIMHLVICPTF